MTRLKLRPTRWLLIFYVGKNRQVSKALQHMSKSVAGKHRVHRRMEQWKLAVSQLVTALNQISLVKPDAVRALTAQLADSSKVSSVLT